MAHGLRDFQLVGLVTTLANAIRPDRLGPSVFPAVQEQLGLRLAAAKAPVDSAVIDRVGHLTANESRGSRSGSAISDSSRMIA